jgi:hypothetical protein
MGATHFMLVSCLAYSLTMTVEATFSPETLVDVQRTAWHYIPEDRTLHPINVSLYKCIYVTT